jgi:ATP-dependent RNA helicase RhlE
MSFASLNLPENLLAAVRDLGYETPTPIQRQAIPPALAGRDLIACAMTGSGKTAAFILPALARLQAAPARKPQSGPRMLVLSPTRELAAQTAEQHGLLGRHTRLRGAAVFGGVGMQPQERAFRTHVEVMVATPGRLLDHLQNGYATLAGVEILVLDEADRMLDMGFLPDIQRVLARLPKERQTLLFSATMPREIATLARQILTDPEQIAIDRIAKPATGVAQSVYPVREDLKVALLLELLRRDTIHNAIVFTRTKHRANRLADKLAKAGVSSDRIHGNRSQSQRTDALARFKAGKVRVLVATDIAARGIDVEALSHVVNFDVPKVPDDYIHRVGRTARAEATGDAWTFVSDAERGELAAIERTIGKTLPRQTVEGFDYQQRGAERFEVPLNERIAEIRARKADERSRARANADRRAANAARASRPATPAASPSDERPRSHRPGARPAPARAAHARPGAAPTPWWQRPGAAPADHRSRPAPSADHRAHAGAASHRPDSERSEPRPVRARRRLR